MLFTGQMCQMGTVPFTKHFLENFGVNEFIDKGDPTPIWHAVSHGHSEVVKLLLRYGCDAEKAAPDGTTPKMIAELHEDEKIMQLLKDIPDCPENKNEPIHYGRKEKSPLISLSRFYPRFHEEIKNNKAPRHFDQLKISCENVSPSIFCPMEPKWLKQQSMEEYDESLRQKDSCTK